jgi:hypothetical protein
MAQKKYVSLSRLSTFLDNLKTTFSSLGHKHKLSDITDYTVDSTLSSASTNPVQNNVIKASLDEKVPDTRTVNGKALSTDITLSASDVGSYTKTEIDSMEFITTSDIDEICGSSIVNANEVSF